MHIQIKQSFTDPSSPRPFLLHEMVTVPDALAERWIAEGKAIAVPGVAQKPAPIRQRRERAVRVH